MALSQAKLAKKRAARKAKRKGKQYKTPTPKSAKITANSEVLVL